MDSHHWLKNYPAQWKLDYPRISNYHYLKQKVALNLEQTALIYNNEQISFHDLIINIDRTAAALSAMGLRKGDRVALLSPLCPAYVYTYYAAMRQGDLFHSSLSTHIELYHQGHQNKTSSMS